MNDQVREKLLSNWFVNTYQNSENEEVLLLFCSSVRHTGIYACISEARRKFSCQISDIKKGLSFKTYSPKDYNMLSTDLVDRNVQNFIYLVDFNSVSEIEHLINFYNDKDKHILFALENDAINALNKSQNNEMHYIAAIGFPEFLNYYLNENRYMDQGLISLVKKDELRPHLDDFITYRNDFIKRFFRWNSYLDNELESNMKNDLELLKQKNLLTSHLAMHLYRLYFFKPNASSTETGRYFHESLGIASKTYTPRSKKLKNCAYVPNKNFKAYDLSINQDKQIRIEIASKLIRFMKSNPNQALNMHTIAKITDLSEADVEEIFDASKRSKT